MVSKKNSLIPRKAYLLVVLVFIICLGAFSLFWSRIEAKVGYTNYKGKLSAKRKAASFCVKGQQRRQVQTYRVGRKANRRKRQVHSKLYIKQARQRGLQDRSS